MGLAQVKDLNNIQEFEFDDEVAEQVENLQEKGNVKVTAIIQQEKKNSLKSEFVMAFTSNLRALAELNISQSELKVITYILEIMEYGNLISLNQSQIARDLDMKKSNMSVIFKKLTKKGVLIKEKGHLFMNSNLFAKGLNHKLNTERRENLKTAQFENDKFTRSF